MTETPDDKRIILSLYQLGACVHCIARFLQQEQKDLRSAEEVCTEVVATHRLQTTKVLSAKLSEEEQVNLNIPTHGWYTVGFP